MVGFVGVDVAAGALAVGTALSISLPRTSSGRKFNMVAARPHHPPTGRERRESPKVCCGENWAGGAAKSGVGVMVARHPAVDAVEREFVSAQLDELALTNEGRPWSAWKEAVLEWHLDALAAARSDVWIPGLADSGDPVVEKALERFYGRQVAATIKRLSTENVELRRRVLEMSARRRPASGEGS